MSSFKDQVAKDLDVFINTDEFADWHYIGNIYEDVKIKCIVQTNESTARSYNRSSSFGDNVFNCDLVIRYKYADFPVYLTPMDLIVFNAVNYDVVHFSNDDGLVELKLNRTDRRAEEAV